MAIEENLQREFITVLAVHVPQNSLFLQFFLLVSLAINFTPLQFPLYDPSYENDHLHTDLMFCLIPVAVMKLMKTSQKVRKNANAVASL